MPHAGLCLMRLTDHCPPAPMRMRRRWIRLQIRRAFRGFQLSFVPQLSPRLSGVTWRCQFSWWLGPCCSLRASVSPHMRDGSFVRVCTLVRCFLLTPNQVTWARCKNHVWQPYLWWHRRLINQVGRQLGRTTAEDVCWVARGVVGWVGWWWRWWWWW